MTEKEALIDIIKENALLTGSFRVRKRKTNYFINLFNITTFPHYLSLIVDILFDELKNEKINKLASPSIESEPIVTAISLKLKVPFVCIRKNKEVYGVIEPHKMYITVADVSMSGQTILDAANLIRGEGGEVLKVYALIDRDQGACKRIEKEGIKFNSIIKLDELIT
jgi:Orotate phosphoribosyltransferase